MDALCHAIESFVARKHNPFSDALARAASGLLVGAIPRLADDEEEARSAVLVGAALAGQALSTSASIITHTLEHPLSARLDAHHGEGLAALQPAVFDRVHEGDPERFAEVAAWLGEKPKAELAAGAFRRLVRSAGLDTSDLENQANSRGSVEALGERLTALEAEVRKPEQPDPLRDGTTLRAYLRRWALPPLGPDQEGTAAQGPASG